MEMAGLIALMRGKKCKAHHLKNKKGQLDRVQLLPTTSQSKKEKQICEIEFKGV